MQSQIEELVKMGFVTHDYGDAIYLSKEHGSRNNCLHEIIVLPLSDGKYFRFSITRTGDTINDCIDLFETTAIISAVENYMKL